jgi:hypothetical protein
MRCNGSFRAVCAHSYKFLISQCVYIAIPNKFTLKMLGTYPNDTQILILKTMKCHLNTHGINFINRHKYRPNRC